MGDGRGEVVTWRHPSITRVYAARRPHVDGLGVLLAGQHDLRRAVPPGMGKGRGEAAWMGALVRLPLSATAAASPRDDVLRQLGRLLCFDATRKAKVADLRMGRRAGMNAGS